MFCMRAPHYIQVASHLVSNTCGRSMGLCVCCQDFAKTKILINFARLHGLKIMFGDCAYECDD
jgi:hypothetical protein